MIAEYFSSSQFNLVVIMENSNVGTVCCEDGCSKRILELEQKFDSMQRYIKENIINFELTNCENTNLKEQLKEQKAMTLKLDAENRLLNQKIVSLEKSNLENQKIDQESRTKSEIQRSQPINPEISNCLGVFGLTSNTTKQELKELFSKFGPLKKVQLVWDPLTRCSKGYAFIYYKSIDDAKIAKEAMCDQKFRGRRVRIDFSITKKPHARTPGFYNGKPNKVKENIISSKKSQRDLENDTVEQKSKIKSENQDSYQDWIKINNCLCVFGLTSCTTEQELKEEFSRFGPVEKVLLVRHPLINCSKGYAFVYYESVEEVKTTKETMYDQEFKSLCDRIDFCTTNSPYACTPGIYKRNPIAMKEKSVSQEKLRHGLKNHSIKQKSTTKATYQDWIRKNPEMSNCLGVFGLPLTTTELELKEQFSKFGPLEKVQIILRSLVLDPLTGRSKGYAFVYYESGEDAKTAKEAMNGEKFKGQRIEVEFSKKKIPESSSCLVVFGLSVDTIEWELKEEFSRFGPLEKFYIMRGNTGRSRGYAFAYYESVEDAKVAKEAMVNRKFNGRRILVNFANNRMPRASTPGFYKGKPTAFHGPSD